MIDAAIEILKTIWNFVAENHEILTSVVGLVGVIGGAIWAAIKWVIPQARHLVGRKTPKRLAEDTFPFEVIKPASNENVVQKIVGADQSPDDPLADFNIPYTPRRKSSSVQDELMRHLQQKRWLLILGRTGLGKTREAAELAQMLNKEGWTVLKLKNSEWVQVPKQFPEAKLGSQPKLLIVLDNLNQAMWLSQQQTSTETDSEKLATLRQPLQERLLELLTFYEGSCGTDRVRVIATARNEEEREGREGELPSQIERLQLEKYSKFWQRFHHYLLPAPEDQAIVEVLKNRTTETHLQANVNDFEGIARRNDGTYRNVVENLVTARSRGLTLTTQTYQDTLQGTWHERYRAAVQQDDRANYIYDAVDLLRQVQVKLRPETVLAAAQILSNDRGLQRWWQGRKLRQILEALEKTERILTPRDGQIEARIAAREKLLNVAQAITPLRHQLLKLANRLPTEMLSSLIEFGIAATATFSHHEDAVAVLEKASDIAPISDTVLLYKGNALYYLGHYEDAINAYDLALNIKPDDHEALNNKGIALNALGHYEDAINAYDLALSFKPDLHEALYNKGNALNTLGHYEDAINAYDLALNIKPDDHEALNSKGNALNTLGHYEDAIKAYDLALNIKPNYHEALNNKGTALYALGHYEDAIKAYDLALSFKSDDHEALNNKGTALNALGHYEDAINAYDLALNIKPDDHEALNSKGNALNTLGHYEDAINAYDLALNIKPDDHEALNNKGIALNALGHYEDAINAYDLALSFKSDDYEALNNKGIALKNLGQHEDAIASYDQALSIRPDRHEALYNKGNALKNLGQYEDAIASYDQALSIRPDDPDALYNKACCYALQNDVTQALVYLKQAIDLNPEWKEYAKTDSDFDGIRESAEWQTFFTS